MMRTGSTHGRRTGWLIGLVALSTPGCGATDTGGYVRVPSATPPATSAVVSRAVGELLSGDPERSAAAEKRLLALDAAELEELRQLAERIPAERDPRWLHVLDEHHEGPALSPQERVAFLLWKAARPEPFFALKARAALAEQARRDPAPLLEALEAGLPQAEALALALAVAERTDAVPALTRRYVVTEDEDERRALVEALSRLLGEETRLRVTAPRDEREREATRVRERFLLGRRPQSAGPSEGPSAGGAPGDG